MNHCIMTLLKLLFVAIVYAAIGALLYRQRIISDDAMWDSDTLVFFLPALLALLVNGMIIYVSIPVGWHLGVKGALTCVGAFTATILASAVYATIVFTLYGT